MIRRGVSHILFFALFVTWFTAQAQQDAWRAPYPGHRVIGNLYYVGTAGLSVFLITSDEGHILINTGMEDSLPLIRDSVESLGFRLEDVKILLTQQSHVDHTGALAELRDLVGAQMWATVKDAKVLEDGGVSDPHFGGSESFRPVQVDRIIRDGEVIELGDTKLTVHEHPGHTEGSSSYSMRVRENGRDYDVVIANMATINDGKHMYVHPTYPGVGDDFAMTFAKQKAMDVDVWVAAHGNQYGLERKYRPGQEYSPDTFVDPEGFYAEVGRLEQLYVDQVAAERAALTKENFNEYTDALTSGDFDTLRNRFYSADFEIAIGDQVMNLDDFLAYEASLRSIMDFDFTLRDIVADDSGIAIDTVENITVTSGTENPMLGAVQPGQKWQARMFVFYTLDAGKIASIEVNVVSAEQVDSF